MKKILLFGKNGQVSRKLYNLLLPLGNIICLGSDQADFTNLDMLRHHIHVHKPDLIINGASYTQVDQAETNTELVFKINTDAVKVIVDEANKINSWFIHYSSDYVFDGTKGAPYSENDLMNPLNLYGTSKANADAYISENSNKYIILRTSSVFDSDGHNFPKTILRLARNQKSLKVVNDQVSCPTSASLIASVTAFIIYRYFSTDFVQNGIYNVVCREPITWYDFAKYLLDAANEAGYKLSCGSGDIIPISSEEYKLQAKRPVCSVLDTAKLTDIFGFVIPSWKLYIPSFLWDLKLKEYNL